jgi:hypothetical protein
MEMQSSFQAASNLTPGTPCVEGFMHPKDVPKLPSEIDPVLSPLFLWLRCNGPPILWNLQEYL